MTKPSAGKLTAAGLKAYIESHSDVHPEITRRLHASGIFSNLKDIIVNASKKHLAPLLKKGVGVLLEKVGAKAPMKKEEIVEEKVGGKITGGKITGGKSKSKRKMNPELLKRARAMGKLMKNGKMSMAEASEYYKHHKHEF